MDSREILLCLKPNDRWALKVAIEFVGFCQSNGMKAEVKEEIAGVDLSNYTDIAIIGGDGTLNYVLNHFNNIEQPIGIVPAGSGNDYVKSIQIGKSKKEMFETAVFGDVKPVDLGRCNDRLFINGFGLGFDGQIAKAFEENRTILRGHAAYYYHVLKILAGFKAQEIQFTVDEKPLSEQGILITIAKGTTFGGGFKLTPEAIVDDGKFAISLIRDLKPLRRFLNIHRLQKGTHSDLAEVQFLKGTKVSIGGGVDMVAHIDGELIGSPPFELEVLPGKVRIRTLAQ